MIRDYYEEGPKDDLEEYFLAANKAQSQTENTAKQKLDAMAPTETPAQDIAPSQDHLTHQPSPLLLGPTPMLDASLLTGPDLFLTPSYSDSAFEDGIFLPGSQYQELHTALRSRIIDTARSTGPSRTGSPPEHTDKALEDEATANLPLEADDEESRRLAHLSAEQEYVLWQNYIDELSPWLDKFDNTRHFELVLPVLAKSNPHLRYSILALSARQMERKAGKNDNSCSLALYQHAIHLLSPLLQQRTTVVLASCVVLCVLEMMSCSPKAWRRHLDGCAALIQALAINGRSGGLGQSLFWVFARMDICGGLISSERTLIPVQKWLGAGRILLDYDVLENAPGSFDMYANRIVFLCGQVVELLCSAGKWEQRPQNQTPIMPVTLYSKHWSTLFELLEKWYQDRPEEMKPLLTIPSPIDNDTKPFQTLFYGNGPAISGNQMYHTATLLMLKYKPTHVQFSKRPQSILWHARQICAISISNSHHGCWTNCVQPLWIAGQHMSHPSEHRAILDIYERIQLETGWATKWRADDLKEYWGELDE